MKSSHNPRLLARHRATLFTLLLTVQLLFSGLIACSPPQDFLERLTPQNSEQTKQEISPVEKKKKVPPKEETPSKKEAADGEDASSTAPKETIEEELRESVNVQQVNSYLEHAGDALSGNYDDFLAREPQQFAFPHLYQSVKSDIIALPRTLQHVQENILASPTLSVLTALLPLLVTLLFCILLTLLDRQANTLVYRWQRAYYSPLSSFVTRLVRSLLLLAGRTASPLILLGLCYFPIMALFGPMSWTKHLAHTFWVLCIYRIVSSAAELLIALPWMRLIDDHARKLRRVLLLIVQLIAIATQVFLMLQAMGLDPETMAFVGFGFEIFLAILPLGLVRIRHELTRLFEEQEDERTIYRSGLMFLMRHYHALLSVTCLLLVMRAFGYVNASTALLRRGYGLIGLLLLGTLILRSVRHFFDERLKPLSANDPQRELLFSIKRLLTMGLAIILVLSATRVLAIYEPLIILLKTPLITLQSVKFSLFNMCSAILIVGAALLSSKMVRAILNARVYPSLNVDIGVAYAINTILGYAVIVVGFFLVLIALGVNLSALTVVAASLSVGIGFGLQTLTENLISGFIILFGRTVRKGDYITISDVYGRVEAVGARSVVVRTPDNYDLLIPSKELVGNALINWTYQDSIVRLHVPVGVSYSCDPRQVEKLLLQTIKNYKRVEQKPEPEVWLVGFGDSSVNFEILVHYDCRKIIPKRIIGELNYLIWDALKEANIEIPFPQRDLHLRSMDILPNLKEMFDATRNEPEAPDKRPKRHDAEPEE